MSVGGDIFSLQRSWPARFDFLDEIRTFVGQAAERAGFSEQAVYAIQMATDEACSNVIEHAYRGESGNIEIRVDWDGLQLTITLQDTARHSFDMKKIAQPDVNAPLSKRKAGGLGIYLMKKLMDEVQYLPSPQGNTLILRKRKEKAV
jgi:anti-sigma regulatory factor (Ser/Thr protein kinase)